MPELAHSEQADAKAAPGIIRIAGCGDIHFVDHLQRKFARQVGFIPRVGIEEYIRQACIRLTTENDEPAGYILSRPKLRWQPLMRSITQACVAMDAQRRHHGLAMLKVIEAEAIKAGQVAIQACCAVGLESNEFWHAAGFRPIVHMTPANVRGREIICWRKPLTNRLPLWFIEPPQRAGYRAANPQSVRNLNRSIRTLELAKRYTTGKARPTTTKGA